MFRSAGHERQDQRSGRIQDSEDNSLLETGRPVLRSYVHVQGDPTLWILPNSAKHLPRVRDELMTVTVPSHSDISPPIQIAISSRANSKRHLLVTEQTSPTLLTPGIFGSFVFLVRSPASAHNVSPNMPFLFALFPYNRHVRESSSPHPQLLHLSQPIPVPFLSRCSLHHQCPFEDGRGI